MIYFSPLTVQKKGAKVSCHLHWTLLMQKLADDFFIKCEIRELTWWFKLNKKDNRNAIWLKAQIMQTFPSKLNIKTVNNNIC